LRESLGRFGIFVGAPCRTMLGRKVFKFKPA
jgi:hypothetical protein